MEIIQVNASYKPAFIYGGPTMSVSRLNEELIKAGVNSEVYTTTANGETELDVKAGIKVNIDGVPVTYFKRITKGNSHFSPALLFSFWRLLQNSENDQFRKKSGARDLDAESISSSNHQIIKSSNLPIVHIHAWWNLVSVGTCILAILRSNPVIISPRGTLSNYSFGNRSGILKNIFHQLVGRSLLKQCNFHVSTEKERQDIFNILRPKSITVIPNFVNLLSQYDQGKIATPKKKDRGRNPFQLLFLSRIEEKKGLDILFKALRKIDLDFHLTIGGSGNIGYVESLKSLASELELGSKISWIGQLDNLKKFKVLARHDLMVLPSHDESFANVVIESLSVGTPVLISSKVGLAEYVQSNNLGWVYESLGELAKSIKSAAADSEKRTSIHSSAPIKIAADFNDQRILSQYLSLYQNISING